MENVKEKNMNDKTKELLERTFVFGVDILKFLACLPENHIYNIPKRQLARAVTSVGSNYEEAQAAESKRDFVHKIGISLKEARESHYWLRILNTLYIDKVNQEKLSIFINESYELKNIFATIKMSAEKVKV